MKENKRDSGGDLARERAAALEKKYRMARSERPQALSGSIDGVSIGVVMG